MSPERIVLALLVLAVVFAWVRLGWWQYRASVRAPVWRLAVLILLQPVVAGSLYATLFAPVSPQGDDRLVIATQGAPRIVPIARDERLIALPEAQGVAGAERAPDLGTALRRHGGATAIRIVGNGLSARDRPAAQAITVRFDPPSPPMGIVALLPPEPVAAGADFTVAARVTAGGAVTLLDPAGRIVDTAKPDADGGVLLRGTARVPGEAVFTLRLSSGETAAVPLVTEAVAPARALLLAAAPGPEAKYLRRWATDAGLAPQAQVAVGGGVSLGDAAAIDPATLARYDVVILDDRSWAALGGGQRAALAQAVRGGLGLVVRLTGPVPRGWQVLGLAAAGGASTAPMRLAPAAPDDAALAARRGPGSRDAPASIAAPLVDMPDLTRVVAALGGVPLLRDARSNPFAAWRNVGRGRVAVVSLIDSFALVTSGNGDAYAAIWSRIASTVGRGRAMSGVRIDPLPRVGERVAICGAARVTTPDGASVALVDDGGGCAGYWPQGSGWHRGGERPFYVYPADALPELRAVARRDATLALVGERSRAVAAVPADPQPSWRWFLLFLASATLLWWFERYRARAMR